MGFISGDRRVMVEEEVFCSIVFKSNKTDFIKEAKYF